MIPVYQTIMHDPDNGQYGDCFRACIASLMELPIKEVPHFMHCNSPEEAKDDTEAMIKLWKWLKPQGLGFFVYTAATAPEHLHAWQDYFLLKLNPDTHHIISGYTARNTFHSVIGKGGHMVHDPYPSGIGLLQPSEENPWVFEFIVKL